MPETALHLDAREPSGSALKPCLQSIALAGAVPEGMVGKLSARPMASGGRGNSRWGLFAVERWHSASGRGVHLEKEPIAAITVLLGII